MIKCEHCMLFTYFKQYKVHMYSVDVLIIIPGTIHVHSYHQVVYNVLEAHRRGGMCGDGEIHMTTYFKPTHRG